MQKKVNVCALLGLVIPIISIIPFIFLISEYTRLVILWFFLFIIIGIVSFVLSIIGLATRSKYNGSGLVDGIIGLILGILIVIVLSTSMFIAIVETSRHRNNYGYYNDYYEEDEDYDDDEDDYDYYYKKEVTIIDFSSMSEEEVKNWCKNNNLTCTIATEYSDTVEKGKFIRQSVAANEVVNEGKYIGIYYSLGKKPTVGQSNALKKAEQYSKLMHMSKRGLYDQLTSEYGEGFTAEEAQYAIDNVNADWKANALEKAKSYQTNLNMSKSSIYQQLISEYGEKFTTEEAQYAIDNLED